MDKVELCYFVCPAPRAGRGKPVIRGLSQEAWEQLINDDTVEVLQVPDILCRGPPWHSRLPFVNFYRSSYAAKDLLVSEPALSSTCSIAYMACSEQISVLERVRLDSCHVPFRVRASEGLPAMLQHAAKRAVLAEQPHGNILHPKHQALQLGELYHSSRDIPRNSWSYDLRTLPYWGRLPARPAGAVPSHGASRGLNTVQSGIVGVGGAW